ncbi:MAG: NADPH-dependent F420 reductase [Mesorhizobium sp.]|nr:MAG: NADPH-dependent F420 reductase [Mesorhizobium sp.]
MKIVILGKGNMGTPLALLAQAAEHQVQSFDSKTNPVAALQSADVVILATKYEQALALREDRAVVAALSGKVVVDITNPLATDYMSLTVGHTSSAAEEIALRLPGAHVVKAFNTVFAALLAQRAAGNRVEVPVFIASDHEAAAQTVAGLAGAMGFTTIFSGTLSNARYLEPMAELMIQLGYGLGHGDRIGFVMRDEGRATAAAA